jgi:hypothetical protein
MKLQHKLLRNLRAGAAPLPLSSGPAREVLRAFRRRTVAPQYRGRLRLRLRGASGEPGCWSGAAWHG